MLLTGCKKDIRTSTGTPDQLPESKTSAKKTTLSSAELKARLAQVTSSLSSGSEQRLIENSSLLLKQHPEYRDLIRRVLAITPTPCDANTLINQWLDQELADWDDDVIFLAIVTGMLDFPTYDALLFVNSSANQYFGLMENTHKG